MNVNIDTVLFDLDGTILDTNELILRSFLQALHHFGHTDITREHIIPHMGKPLDEQLRDLSGRDDVEALRAKYRESNWAMHDQLVSAFPYVKEVVEELHQAGITLGVVTTKIRKTTDMGLKLTGLYDYMKALITLDDVQNPKPHPEPVLKALEALGARAENTIMVGDSGADIDSANAAGVTSVAVTWTLKGIDALLPHKPKHVISDMRELLDLVGVKRGSY
ncbi:pyrophosphatase PpaX [Paenibacillus turpanensis]|uniref:pyrophosphatase PpaX n=1 Tax=Paenibacillus turpanensis TaxID=2689078 RepID=UPI0014075D98|nr:pyrophosphatase PpaX [Paenibacillus turpanensis]